MTDTTDQNKGPVDLSTAKVISDTFFVSFSRILVLLMKPVRGIILGRLLGPALYGILNIPVPYVNILKLLSNIGFNTAVVKLVPAYRQKGRMDLARMILRSTAALTVTLGALWSILIVVLAPQIAERIAHRPDALNPIRLYALIIPFLAMNTFYISAYLAVQRGKLQGAITLWHGVLQVALPLAFILIRRSVTLVIGGLVAAEVIGTILFAVYLGRRGLAGFGGGTGPLARGAAGSGAETGPLGRGMREVWGFGRLFFFTDLGWMMIHSVDKLMVQNLLDIEQYGFYAMAALVITGLSTIATTGGIALVPSLTVARESGDAAAFRRQARNTARLGFIVLVPIVAMIIVLIGDFFAIVLPRFVPSVPVIRTLACIGFVLVFSRVAWATLVAYGRGTAASIAYIFAAVWNVAWNWILIPPYGIVGAAMATLSTFIVLALVLQILMYRVSREWVGIGGLIHAVLISLLFPILGWLMPGAGHLLRIISVTVTGCVLYGILSLVTRLVRAADLEKVTIALRPRAHVPHVHAALGLIGLLRRIAR